ncbi:MAG: glycosyltransferase [Candidatus Omnitrophota bacterium]|jgi:GT2 family glycosyltransferase
MSAVLVSIIIVTAGKEGHIHKCLSSIVKQSFRNTETIVIDNSLNSALGYFIAREFPFSRVLKSEKNLFYCAALNKGIAESRGEFVLCLNDDVVLDERFVEEALRGFSVGPGIGMVSGKILRPDKKTIDSAGLFLSLWRTPLERGYGRIDRGQFERQGYVFGVNGAVAFYRKEMLNSLLIKGLPGGQEYFDTDLGFFYEDLDIAWRAQKSGWKGYYIPAAIAYHVRGATARQSKGINKRFARFYLNDELNFNLIRNRYLVIIKNDKLLTFLACLFFMILFDLVTFAYLIIFRPTVLKFFFNSAIPFRSALRKRKLIKQLKRI